MSIQYNRSSDQAQAKAPHAITLGRRLDRPKGRCVELQAADPIGALARVLEEHVGVEAWIAPAAYEDDYVDIGHWRSSGVIGIDADYYDAAGEHAALPDDLAARIDDLAVAAAEHDGDSSGLPGHLIYRTPRGLRILYLLDEILTDRDRWVRAARGASDILRERLAELGLERLGVDRASTRPAQRWHTPRATVGGLERDGRVTVMRHEPIAVAALIAHAPPETEGEADDTTAADQNTRDSSKTDRARRSLAETYEWILSRLEHVNRSRDRATARCPAHDDQAPSLSLRLAEDRILLHCLAQCATDQVVAALGLRMSDLRARAKKKPRPPSASSALMEIATETCELYHGPDDSACASIMVDGHRETYLVRSTAYRQWLAGQYYRRTSRAASGQAIADALAVVQARAIHDGPEHPIALRIAEHEGSVYLDLGRSDWSAVRVRPDGWDVVAVPSIRFVRRRTLGELPIPVRGGSIDELRDCVNVRGEDEWVLYVGALVGMLAPRGPYMILSIQGCAGSAKSTAAEIARACVDPGTPALRSPPRRIEDLYVSAVSAHVVAYDNLSHIPGWLSDALCTVATGGGLAKRELYTDADEYVLAVQRPVILTSIEPIIYRGDLADRTVTITLDAIPEGARKEQREVWAAFERARPRILGALLDGMSSALARRDEVRLAALRLPRMADAAIWISAAETGLGWARGTYSRVLTRHIEATRARALEDDALGIAVRELAGDGTVPWTGTAADLLRRLERWRPEGHSRAARSWPETPRALAGRLARISDALRAHGIDVRAPQGCTGRDRRRVYVISRLAHDGPLFGGGGGRGADRRSRDWRDDGAAPRAEQRELSREDDGVEYSGDGDGSGELPEGALDEYEGGSGGRGPEWGE